MTHRLVLPLFVLVCSASLALAEPYVGPTKLTIDDNHVLSINGKKVFPITFTIIPPPDAKAPSGKLALEEWAAAGAHFIRTGPMADDNWDKTWMEKEKAYQEAAGKAGMLCNPWLKELSGINNDQEEKKLREVIKAFKDSPGMGCWKGEDEPQWAKKPAPPLEKAYKIIHEEDPNHPVWIVQAPRGTVAELKPYNVTFDIGGVDIYPIGYPQGTHVPADKNKEISMVGDYTRKMLDVVEYKKPIWLTLQIAWSGVSRREGANKNTLRFPTFPQERFMAYEAIINGARGLVFFGGGIKPDLNERDAGLGWNWTFFDRVLRDVLAEVGQNSPLQPALVAANSKLPVKVKGEAIEFLVREAGGNLYILACCKDPQKTAEYEFTGLPKELTDAEVMFEPPRKVTAKDGVLKDWFAPWEVHVYKFSRAGGKAMPT